MAVVDAAGGYRSTEFVVVGESRPRRRRPSSRSPTSFRSRCAASRRPRRADRRSSASLARCVRASHLASSRPASEPRRWRHRSSASRPRVPPARPDGRAGELAQRRALLHPAHRRRDGVFASATRIASANSVAGIMPPSIERQHRRVAQQRRQISPLAPENAAAAARAIATKPVASSRGGRTPRCSSRPAPRLPIMLTAAASAVNAGGGSAHARGGVDHRQGSRSRQPLARVERETRRHQPGAEQGQRALHAPSRLAPARRPGHRSPRRATAPAPSGRARRAPAATPASPRRRAQRPDQQASAAPAAMGAPGPSITLRRSGATRAADQPQRGQHHHRKPEALDRA